jgi:hypothetical protein
MDDGRTALSHVAERYRQDMDETRLTSGEFDTVVRRMNEKDYTPKGINYQVGNLDRQRHEAMVNNRVDDSKIMAIDKELYHGTADKNANQKIPADLLGKVYQLMQTPERIYENTAPRSKRFGREFHFVKDTKDGKVLKVVLRQQQPATALRVITMGWMEDDYGNPVFKKMW